MCFLKPGRLDCPRLAEGRRRASVRWGRWRSLCRTGSRRESGPRHKRAGSSRGSTFTGLLARKVPKPRGSCHHYSQAIARHGPVIPPLINGWPYRLVWGSTAYVLSPAAEEGYHRSSRVPSSNSSGSRLMKVEWAFAVDVRGRL